MLTVEISSFSYKDPLASHIFSWDEGRHGGGFVFDMRSLPNPGREMEFKAQTGLDPAVIAFLENSPEVRAYREHSFALVRSSVDNFLERGFTYLTVGFGCTGGQHRSVYFTQQLARVLVAAYGSQLVVRVRHVRLGLDEVLK